MSFDVSVAGVSLPTDATALKSFRDELNLAFHLESTFSALLDTTLDKVPSSACSSTVNYTSPAASWQPGGGPVTFGLQGGASGAFDVLTSGSILDYTDGLDSPQTKSIAVPAGKAYARLTLSFTISGNAAATYSGGAYGVDAALNAGATYKIIFCKAFAPATLLKDAIQQTFECFVLPFHPKTLDQMANGDYLQHEFDGNLHLSFGAYVGLDKVLYAGQASTDVLQALGSSVVSLSAAVSPEFKAGVSLDFSFQYTNKFEALISRQANAARLHLYKAQSSVGGGTLKAGLTFDANISGTIGADLTTVQNAIKSAAAGTSATAANGLDKVLSAGSGAINNYIGEANTKVASWFSRANGIQVNLQAAIEATRSRTLLVGYAFDLTAANYAAAWADAINGDFVKAYNTAGGGVALEIGSGLEQSYQTKTSFDVNFFNLWHWDSWSSFASKATLVYAGNNIFHLLADVGRASETDAVGAMRSMNFYFALVANVAASGVASAADISLHLDLTSKGDKGAASRIAKLLDAVGGGPVCHTLAQNLRAFATNSKTGTVELHITIPQAAYASITCDPCVNGTSSTNGTLNDSRNWKAFADAANDLDAWAIPDVVSGTNASYLQSFQAWEVLNTMNGDPLNRLNTGYALDAWPTDKFPPGIGTGQQILIRNSLVAGQNFMNFCADLESLFQTTSVTAVPQPWQDLLHQVTTAIKRDADIDFARPATLALLRLCGTHAMTVEGPIPPVLPVDLFAVKLSL